VWEAQTGEERFAVPGDLATWNTDEALLLIIDGSEVQLCYTQMKDLLEVACQRAPRNLTRVEWRRFMEDQEYRAMCPDLPLDEETLE
jgi:hypothetical protein